MTAKLHAAALAAPLLVALAGCGRDASGTAADAGTSGDAPTETARDSAADAIAPVDAAPDAASPGCDATPLATRLVTLITAIDTAMAAGGGAGSGALVIPTIAERDAFAANVVLALRGDRQAACRLPPSYRLVRLQDAQSGDVLVIAELDGGGAPAPAKFWGTYAARASAGPSRALVVEAPHPLFDTNTPVESADVFLQSRSRWLLIGGSHRCANSDPSGCVGTTTACGARAPYRVSDPAHAVATPFFAIHAALSSSDAELMFLQLHGNASACPAALVSDSSGTWSDAGPAGKLAAALVAAGVAVGKCGAGYPASGCDLCGTDNVEARMSAGSTDACTLAGLTYGRFVHVEQLAALRAPPSSGVKGYQPMIDAVRAAFEAK